MNLMLLNTLFSEVKTSGLHGRYITNSDIEKCLENLSKPKISTLGYSVEERPIYSLKFGNGPIKILLWSQMHGNESTSTKTLFDCFNVFETEHEISKQILEQCTLEVIPILNPDGAERYTRINANEVDLNRDAQDLSQPESKILRQAYIDFKPDYCFNLHGQRTIFSAGETNKVATLSFLSPAQDQERQLTANRKAAMVIIAQINELLQAEIPNGIGRYDDGFNLNCVGDTFQSFGVPTLLYEAGHYRNDYDREEVRRLMFIAVLKGLEVIVNGVHADAYKAYFDIPENAKCFYDIIIRNAKCRTMEGCVDIAIQYKEVLKQGKLEFIPIIEEISKLNSKFGHKEIEANQFLVEAIGESELNIGSEIDFVILKNERISLKP
ncbi:M14 family zinc carboxypeptidase [Winogradskyella psychrotolerans]|uniref:M14 family zinc carboxypeptidase n=1 Tax=Winogradskyella psychrotolerans TaxID=1344585 RepID=UPI001C0678D0|nr:M14 family zinc carboxypeptidase [Winogradskyella psychrotolerans]MBU2930106.1 peptidase M14 [Winogradskyella psychrotolerans]